jgi:YidC/Oxa1 family membrane protein insertase
MKMQKNDKPNFFDPKTILAIASVAVVYFGWQTYLSKKYPTYGKGKPAVTAPAETKTDAAKTETAAPSSANEIKTETVAPVISEQSFPFKNDKVSYVLSNEGMGLKSFAVENYQDKENNTIKLGNAATASLFEMRLAGSDKPVVFDVKEETPGTFVGTAHMGTMTIKRELKYNADNSSFSNKVSFTNPTEDLKKGFSLVVPETIHTQAHKSFLFPSYEHQDFFVGHNSKKDTVNFSAAKEDFTKDFPTTHLVSVGSQYFASAILDKSEIIPEVILKANLENKLALAELTYKPTTLTPEMTFSQILYAGPKSIDSLKAVDPELAHIIDFGFFGMIATPLVYVMKAFHALVGNWGFAIILLTLMVRLCVLPFNMMSMKSMKAMQRVQPVIAKLREKHKDDPMRLNQEMMAVMKQNGANPMGSCLPMLIQIPVFFALYRVIGSSIELYNSPFIFWITDLSSHDKFYVLPVLMAVFMFIQQKITPSTMDPTQAKIMAFLPLVFSLFMLQLPSGLTLYMVVSTLFGITQQYLLMRDKKSA